MAGKKNPTILTEAGQKRRNHLSARSRSLSAAVAVDVGADTQAAKLHTDIKAI